MDASLRLRSVQHDKVVSFRTLFFVIPNAVRNPVHGCFASLSMTKATVSFRTLFFVIPSESEESMTLFVLAKADASLRLRFVQNDKSGVILRQARNPVWMLCFAQHDKLGSWIPHFADASVSMTKATVSFRTQ